MKDVVFPSRSLKRQLEDAHTKLREMEEELKAIKDSERNKQRKTDVCVHTLS